jgi:hypothetical protein
MCSVGVYVQQKFSFCYFFIYVVKSIAFKALQWSQHSLVWLHSFFYYPFEHFH